MYRHSNSQKVSNIQKKTHHHSHKDFRILSQLYVIWRSRSAMVQQLPPRNNLAAYSLAAGSMAAVSVACALTGFRSEQTISGKIWGQPVGEK